MFIKTKRKIRFGIFRKVLKKLKLVISLRRKMPLKLDQLQALFWAWWPPLSRNKLHFF